MNQYKEFLKKRSIPVSSINIGSSEYAIPYEQVFEAVKILENNQVSIKGGDVLTLDSDNTLKYAYQIWGDEYISLNWYCDKLETETEERYYKRSIEKAKRSIEKAIEVSSKFNSGCLFVLVV